MSPLIKYMWIHNFKEYQDKVDKIEIAPAVEE